MARRNKTASVAEDTGLDMRPEDLLKAAELAQKEASEDKLAASYKRWFKDISLFAREAVGMTGNKEPIPQEIEVFEAFSSLCHAKLRVYEWQHENGDEPSEKEKELAKKIGVSVMAGRGVGKDTSASIIILWFLSMFEYPKVLCTGPSGDQVQSVLWSEIAKWLYNKDSNGDYSCILKDFYELQAKKLFFTDLPTEEIGKRWFAEARTVSKYQSQEDQAQTLAGRHEDYLLFVIGESSGVPDPVFQVLEGGMTGKLNVALQYFNPTKRSGFSFRSQFGSDAEQNRWIKIHLDAEQSSLVSKDSIKHLEDVHGRESNFFRIHVKGLPPFVDSETLIPAEWVDAAVERNSGIVADSDIVIASCDPALGGGCEAALYIRQGAKGLGMFAWPLIKDPDDLGEKVLLKIREFDADIVCIDSIGIGIAIVQYLRRFWDTNRVMPVDVRQTARNPERFIRTRDELWWRLRERFREGTIGLVDDELLKSQLSTIKQLPPAVSGQTKIEDKFMLKRRNAGSLDRAEALMISMKIDDTVGMKKQDQDEYEKEDSHDWMSESAYSWMGA